MLEAKQYTTDELAAILLKFPAGTKVIVRGTDEGGYDAINSNNIVVATTESINKQNYEQGSNRSYEENQIAIFGVEFMDYGKIL